MPKQSQAITPEHKRVLRVEDFEQMTLEERIEFITQTFNNYHKAQVAYLNNITIQKLTASH